VRLALTWTAKGSRKGNARPRLSWANYAKVKIGARIGLTFLGGNYEGEASRLSLNGKKSQGEDHLNNKR
jgi:hypothetical protein